MAYIKTGWDHFDFIRHRMAELLIFVQYLPVCRVGVILLGCLKTLTQNIDRRSERRFAPSLFDVGFLGIRF